MSTKYYHVVIDLDFAKHEIMKSIKNDKQQCMFADIKTGRPSSNLEVLKIIEDAESKGFKVVPAYDNIDQDGKCNGHEQAKEKVI